MQPTLFSDDTEDIVKFAVIAIIYCLILTTWTVPGPVKYYEPVGSHFFPPFLSELVFAHLQNSQASSSLIYTFQVLLPALNLALVYSILRRILSNHWAITLALLGMSFIPGYPFREFLWDFLSLDRPSQLHEVPIAIVSPIPNVSLLVFLISFKLASQLRYFSFWRASLSTTSAALLMYFHALAGALIFFYWFVSFIIRCNRQGSSTLDVFGKAIGQISIFSILCLPGFLNIQLSVLENSVSSVSHYYFLVYLCLPLSCLLFVTLIVKVDPKEIIYRFSGIYLLLILEGVFLFIDYAGILAINFDYLSQGPSQALLHQLYYAPCIYFIARGNASFNSRSESKNLRMLFSQYSLRLFEPVERIFLPFMVFMLLLYNLEWIY